MARNRTESPTEPNRQPTRADPLGRAMLAHWHDDPGRLTYRDGAETQDGNVAEFYFSSPESWESETIDRLERLADAEPILDVGCGAGKHLLWWTDHGVEAVGIDASPNAILTARERCEVLRPREDGETAERGLEDILVGDMFDLAIETGSVGSVHAVGTQLGLGRSLAGVRELLGEFARVTGDDGVAVVDNYDPKRLDDDFLGYRSDPREGVAHRCFHLEYESADGSGERGRIVGRTLQFLLCSPARLREATIDTPWLVTDVRRTGSAGRYIASLAKEE